MSVYSVFNLIALKKIRKITEILYDLFKNTGEFGFDLNARENNPLPVLTELFYLLHIEIIEKYAFLDIFCTV